MSTLVGMVGLLHLRQVMFGEVVLVCFLLAVTRIGVVAQAQDFAGVDPVIVNSEAWDDDRLFVYRKSPPLEELSRVRMAPLR